MGFGHEEKSTAGKVGVGPPHIICVVRRPADLLSFAQYCTQTPSDFAVETFKHVVIGVLEILVPSPDNRVELLDDGFETVAIGAWG